VEAGRVIRSTGKQNYTGEIFTSGKRKARYVIGAARHAEGLANFSRQFSESEWLLQEHGLEVTHAVLQKSGVGIARDV
jgi:hypothetical protein